MCKLIGGTPAELILVSCPEPTRWQVQRVVRWLLRAHAERLILTTLTSLYKQGYLLKDEETGTPNAQSEVALSTEWYLELFLKERSEPVVKGWDPVEGEFHVYVASCLRHFIDDLPASYSPVVPKLGYQGKKRTKDGEIVQVEIEDTSSGSDPEKIVIALENEAEEKEAGQKEKSQREERRQRLLTAVDKLPLHLGNAYKMVALGRMTTKGAAEAAGVSKENMRVRVHRAEMALRTMGVSTERKELADARSVEKHEREEHQRELQRELQKLPPDLARAYDLVKVQGMKVEDAAKASGVKRKLLSALLRRTKQLARGKRIRTEVAP